MLKIYLRRSKFELHNNDELINLGTFTTTVIREESEAVSETVELGAYTEAAEKSFYPDCEFFQKRKGIKAIYWKRDGCAVLKQWLAPNAKLIRYRAYTEYSCSMSELMKLPVSNVIAYLKQEGMNLILPS